MATASTTSRPSIWATQRSTGSFATRIRRWIPMRSLRNPAPRFRYRLALAFRRGLAMASPLCLTILIGPMVAVPAPKPLIDALVSAEVTVSAVGRSGFSLTFTLANNSPLQTLFMLTGGAPIPFLRVILVVTLGGLPQVIADGVIEHHEVTPDAMG